MGLLLITGGTVVTLGTAARVIPGGWVLVDGDTIRDVGSPDEVASRTPELNGDVTMKYFDATGCVVMPGLICAHHHLYSTFARGMPMPGFSPTTFQSILEGLWWKLDRLLEPGDVRASAMSALIEGLRAGTTCVIDHHESQGFQSGVLDELAGACRAVGVRACLTLGASDRDDRGMQGVEENRRFIQAVGTRDPLIRAIPGLHASFTVSQETLEATADLARRTQTGIHVHVAEDPSDEQDALARYGQRVVERLDASGAVGPSTLVAHGVHLDEAERDVLAAREAWVLHNPESNMNNAVGTADILHLQRRGIRVALGTDGMSSDMRAQCRAAYLLQRHVHGDARVAFGESLHMLLNANAALASHLFGRSLGVLAPGALADVVAFRYDPPTPMDVSGFGGHLLFGLVNAPVQTVMVGGIVRLQSGRIVALDDVAIQKESRERAQALWKRFGS